MTTIHSTKLKPTVPNIKIVVYENPKLKDSQFAGSQTFQGCISIVEQGSNMCRTIMISVSTVTKLE